MLYRFENLQKMKISVSDKTEFMCLNDLASIQQFLARKKEKKKALINVPIARMFRQKRV